jgi:hypothetical protein
MIGFLLATLVLLPLDNVSGEQNAYADVPALVAKAVEAKGWTVKSGSEIEAFLEGERVRYVDSIEEPVLKKLLEKTGADAVLAFTVYTYAQGRNPTVAMSARLVDAKGETVWGNVAALAASDTERAFGLGKKETVNAVAPEVVGVLFRDFAKARNNDRRGRLSLHHGRPVAFRSPDLSDAPRRVCVLPFDNLSNAADAPRVVADIVALRLEAAGFDVVDPATLRAAALKARVSFHSVTSQDLAALAPHVGTTLFLRGTIYKYDASPAVDLETSLVDAAAGKVLWASQHGRSGTDYIGFLMLGAVSSSVSLTDRVASEMIATAGDKHAQPNHSRDRAPLASAMRNRGQHHAGEGQR